MIATKTIQLHTKGNTDILDITSQVQNAIRDSEIESGIVSIFTPSSTSGLTTIEYESGCLQDLQRFFEENIGAERHYAHNARWGDGNGHSHIRAAILGPSLYLNFLARAIR